MFEKENHHRSIIHKEIRKKSVLTVSQIIQHYACPSVRDVKRSSRERKRQEADARREKSSERRARNDRAQSFEENQSGPSTKMLFHEETRDVAGVDCTAPLDSISIPRRLTQGG